MSIQFRARTITKTLDSYSPTVSESDIGCCCRSTLATSNQSYLRSKCISSGGYFTNTTDCSECADTTVSCPTTFNFLSNNSGSCCYSYKENNIYYFNCVNKQSDIECLNIHEGVEEGIKYKFTPNSNCEDNLPCTMNKQLGNCCTQQLDNSVLCSISQKKQCSGFWSRNDYIQSCSGSTHCNGVYFSGVTAERSSAIAVLSELQLSNNPIEKLPEPNSIYQGGLYVGIFVPGTPINSIGSKVFGNPLSGMPKEYTARGNTNKTKTSSWILIAAQQDFPVPKNCKMSSIILNNSSYDGAFNTNKSTYVKDDLYDKVKNFSYNGFNDWYIPSQDELAFYAKTTVNYSDIPYFIKFYESLYLSSTVYSENQNQNFKSNYLVYSQKFNKENYGEVSLVSRNTFVNIRLFRRIYLNN